MYSNSGYTYTMNRYYYTIKTLPAMEKQEKWRRKQINTLYYTGRPIFGKYVEKFR
jgi:hypothetical protein|uniref:Uncharacterized protein n=1 Tax=viral metagenome TaxID=1070528 RepID=A0A6C0IRY6_9ZZZZ